MKKLITCISLALVVALVPLGFIGCKKSETPKSLVGTYTISDLEVTLTDPDGKTDTFKLENEEDYAKTTVLGGAAQMGMFELIVNMLDCGVGVTLNKAGEAKLYIPDNLDVEKLMKLMPASAVADMLKATPTEEDVQGSGIPTVEDIKDVVASFVKTLTWFVRGDEVILSGEFSVPADPDAIDDGSLFGDEDIPKIVLNNIAYFSLTKGKNTLTAELTINIAEMQDAENVVMLYDPNSKGYTVYYDENGNYATTTSANRPTDLYVTGSALNPDYELRHITEKYTLQDNYELETEYAWADDVTFEETVVDETTKYLVKKNGENYQYNEKDFYVDSQDAETVYNAANEAEYLEDISDLFKVSYAIYDTSNESYAKKDMTEADKQQFEVPTEEYKIYYNYETGDFYKVYDTKNDTYVQLNGKDIVLDGNQVNKSENGDYTLIIDNLNSDLKAALLTEQQVLNTEKYSISEKEQVKVLDENGNEIISKETYKITLAKR